MTHSNLYTLNRRKLLQAAAALAAGSVVSADAGTASAQEGGKVIIGAFADGGLTPFKDKIIPLAKAEGNFDVTFLEDEYGVTLEKWFADAQNAAGQYDMYLLDDPWVPQFGAADVLEDLGAGGIDAADSDWIQSMIEMGYWPPRQGPRVKGFESADPKLIALPFVGDLQTLTYRNDVYTDGAPKTWDELIEKGKAGVAAGTIKYPIVFRGVAGNPIVTGWQGRGRLLRRADEAKCARRRGRVRFRPGRCGDTRRRGRCDHPIFGERAEGGRSQPVESGRQARLRCCAEEGEGDCPDGHFHRRRAEIGA
jgi:multiple sugar transport system substrate-binding protein